MKTLVINESQLTAVLEVLGVACVNNQNAILDPGAWAMMIHVKKPTGINGETLVIDDKNNYWWLNKSSAN